MKINYWKWGIIAALILAWSLYMRSCGIKSVIKTTHNDTTTTKNTVEFKDRPVPYRVDSMVYVKGKIRWLHDTLEPLVTIVEPGNTFEPLDTVPIAFYDKMYIDSFGSVRIVDTLAGNRIYGRSVFKTCIDKTITKTTVQPEKRMVGYFTMSALYGNNIIGTGGGLALKFKDDKIIQLEVKAMRSFTPVYKYIPTIEARYFLPIKLKR